MTCVLKTVHMMRPALSGDTVESGRLCCRQAKCRERTEQEKDRAGKGLCRERTVQGKDRAGKGQCRERTEQGKDSAGKGQCRERTV